MKKMRAFSFFSQKFFSISRFLEVPQVKVRYQRFQRGALNRNRAFSSSNPKFFSLISPTGEREVSTDTNAVHEKKSRNFVFLSKHFSSISPFLKVEQLKERCKTVPSRCLNRMRTFSFFVPKLFFRYLDF